MKTNKLPYLVILLLACVLNTNAQSFNGQTTGPAPQGLSWGQTDAAAVDFFTNLSSVQKKCSALRTLKEHLIL